MNSKFSYSEYRKIIKKYKPLIKDFKEVKKKTKSFCIIRHDVEFSINRALSMAKIDNSLGIKSSFFFQVNSPCYNLLSYENINKIHKIINMKHFIGLHFYILKNEKKKIYIINQLKNQIKIMQTVLGIKIDRISIHRPPKVDT